MAMKGGDGKYNRDKAYTEAVRWTLEQTAELEKNEQLPLARTDKVWLTLIAIVSFLMGVGVIWGIIRWLTLIGVIR